MTGKVRVAPRAQAVGGRGLPGRHRGRGAARPADLGRARPHQAGLRAGRPAHEPALLPHHARSTTSTRARTSGTRTRPSWPTRCAATAAWRGDRVYFLTGTDEHGDKIAQAAAAAGVTPQAYADRDRRRLPRDLAAARHHQRRLHPHHRAAPPEGRAGDPPDALRRGRDLLRRVRRLVLLRLRALLHREGDRGRQVPRPPDARSPSSRRRTTSSRCRSTRSG